MMVAVIVARNCEITDQQCEHLFLIQGDLKKGLPTGGMGLMLAVAFWQNGETYDLDVRTRSYTKSSLS